jgi:hypothetical protein
MDVAYHSIEEARGKFFRCEAYRATLSTDACARRWKEAQAAAGHGHTGSTPAVPAP